MNLKNLSNDNLLLKTKNLSAEERKITTDMLHHLREIEFRRLHLHIGYSSLFEYCVKELGYGEDAAYRRVNAMRLLKSVPEVENKIRDGVLSLAGAAKIQKFITQKNRVETSAPRALESKKDKLDLIESLENKSLQDMERAIVKLSPESIPQEKVRQITEDKVELKLVIDEDLKKQLDHLKNLLSHRNPNMSYQELIKYLTQMGLQKFDLSKRVKNTEVIPKDNKSQMLNTKPSSNQRDVSCQTRRVASKPSRNIPSTIKQEVYMRDKGCCTYTDPKSKRKCESRHLLQYDHRYPFSLGGETTVQNIRLLCFQHHKYITENTRTVGL